MATWAKTLAALIPVLGSLAVAATQYMDARAKAEEKQVAQAAELRCVQEFVKFVGAHECVAR